MWQIDIPGFNTLEIENLVFDFNGTLAVDGELIPGVEALLMEHADQFTIYIVTADTFGKAAEQVKNTRCKLEILPAGNQAKAKQHLIQQLGNDRCIAVGNGRNDHLMLGEAAIGIAVVQAEGASAKTLQSADIVCNSILDALQLLKSPKRLIATLRD